MKFTLKDNQVYVVENYGIPNNIIEASVEAPGFSDYTIEYKINTGVYKPLENGKVTIGLEDLKKTNLNVVFRAMKENNILYFKSDDIPITHAVILGKKLEDAFPERFNHLERRMQAVEEILNIKQKEIDENITNTKDTLEQKVQNTIEEIRGVLKETVEVFEDINRKGSLF